MFWCSVCVWNAAVSLLRFTPFLLSLITFDTSKPRLLWSFMNGRWWMNVVWTVGTGQAPDGHCSMDYSEVSNTGAVVTVWVVFRYRNQTGYKLWKPTVNWVRTVSSGTVVYGWCWSVVAVDMRASLPCFWIIERILCYNKHTQYRSSSLSSRLKQPRPQPLGGASEPLEQCFFNWNDIKTYQSQWSISQPVVR